TYAARSFDALVDLKPKLARNQRWIAMKAQVEWLRAVAAPDLQQVAEALGRQQRCLRPRALQQRVDNERGSMLDEACLARIQLGFADAVKDGVAQLTVGGGAFGVGNRTSFDIAGHEIGKGSADVDCDDE